VSYDLLVFEPTAAPREREAFMAWYRTQAEWSEGHSYDDPRVCSAALQRWFAEIARTFPPMNGPLASEDADDPRVTDHSCGRNVIYSAFASSVAPSAYETVKALALKHNVGFFAASESDGELIFPAAE
jgi:hypothetical protein